jgi:hypothetical protein
MFTKTYGKDRAMVVLNFTDKEKDFGRPVELNSEWKLLVSSAEGVDGTEKLGPYEGRIYLVD